MDGKEPQHVGKMEPQGGFCKQNGAWGGFSKQNGARGGFSRQNGARADFLGKVEPALGVFPAKGGAPARPAKGGDPQAVAQWSGARLRPPHPPEPAEDGLFASKWHDLAQEPTFWLDSLHTRPVSGDGAVRTGFGTQNGRRTAENGKKRSDFYAKTTDFDANTTDFDAKTTDFDAKTTDFDAKTTDSDTKATDFDTKTADFVAKATDFDAKTTNVVATFIFMIYLMYWI